MTISLISFLLLLRLTATSGDRILSPGVLQSPLLIRGRFHFLFFSLIIICGRFFLFSSFFSPFLLSSFYLSSSSSSLFAFPHVGVLMDYILRNKKGEGKHEPRGITQLHSRQNHSKFFPSPLCTSWKCNGIGGIFIPSELALYNNISASLAER